MAKNIVDLSELPDEGSVPSVLDQLPDEQQNFSLDDLPDEDSSNTANFLDVLTDSFPEPLKTAAHGVKQAIRETNDKRFSDTGEAIIDQVLPSLNPLIKPLAKTPQGRRIIGNLSRGVTGTVGGTLGSLPAAESLVGLNTPIGKYGESSSRFLRELSRELEPEDPTFYDNLISGAASMAAFMMPSAGAASVVANIPKLAVMGTRIAPLIGASVSTVFESMTEAGNVFMDQVDSGVDRAQAGIDALENFTGNILLIALTNLFGIKGSAARRAIKGMAKEGIQEAGQEILTASSKGEDIDMPQVMEAAGIGAILGAGAAPLLGATDIPGIRYEAPAVSERVALQRAVEKAQSKEQEIQKQVEKGQVRLIFHDSNKDVPAESLDEHPGTVVDPDGAEDAVETLGEFFAKEGKALEEQELKQLSDEFGIDLSVKPEDIVQFEELESGLQRGIEGVKLPESLVKKEAIILRNNDIDRIRESQDEISRYVIENGGIRQFVKDPETGQVPFKEEFKDIDKKYKSKSKEIGAPADIMAQNIVDNNIGGVGSDFTGGDLLEYLRTQKVERVAKLDSYLDEAEDNVRDRLSRYKRVQKGLARQIKKINFPSRVDAPKVYTEMQALRRSLKVQAVVAANTKRQTTKSIQDVKNTIRALIKTRLPKESQRKFIDALANVTDYRKLIDVTTRIDQEAERAQRRLIKDMIKVQLKRIRDAKNIDIGAVEQIQSLADSILIEKPRPITLQKLLNTKRYIDAMEDSGKDVYIPRYVYQRLRMLSSKPLADMSTAEMENILTEIKHLADVGKVKFRIKQELKELRMQRDLANLIAGSRQTVQFDEKQSRMPGDLSAMDKLRNKYMVTREFMQNSGLSITPIDVLFDMADGNQFYQGPNYMTFKAPVDLLFNNYLRLRDSLMSEIEDLAIKLRLNQDNFNRIGIYAIAKQEGGEQKLFNTGFSENEIVQQLTKEEAQFYNFMRKRMDGLFPSIQKVMKDVYNKPVTKVKGYFPFVTNWDAMVEGELSERMKDQFHGFKSNYVPGAVEERKGPGKQKVNVDAFDVYKKHMDDMAYMLNMSEKINYLGQIVKDPKYAGAVGQPMQKAISEWIDVLARKGGNAHSLGRLERFFRKLRINLGVGTFAFKVSTAIIQPTAIGLSIPLIGHYAFKGSLAITSKDWRNFIMDNFSEIRDRFGDDPAYREFRGQGDTLEKIAKVGFYPMRKMDLLPASAVAAGAYMKYIKEKGIDLDFNKPNKEGIRYAQLMVRRSQSTGQYKDSPLSITSGKFTGIRELDRAIFQYQNFVLNQFSLIKHELYDLGVKKGDAIQAANVFFWIMTTIGAETMVRLGLKEVMNGIFGIFDDDPDSFLERYLVELGRTIPFVGPLMGTAMYESIPVPALDVIYQSIISGARMVKAKEDITKAKAGVRFAGLVGRSFGLPGALQIEEFFRLAIKGSE